MKQITLFRIAAFLLCQSAIHIPLSSLAQGSLTPPGAPAPAMKTLEQIEPRTPISSLPYTITNAGSYYLTTNLSGGLGGGITISNSNVTLDLMGFELGGGVGSGVFVADVRTNICIRNGTVRNWLGWGVYAATARNCVLEDLRAFKNGLTVDFGGLRASAGSLVRGCVAADNTGDGISTGFGSTVSSCTVENNGGNGFSVTGNGTVSGCTAGGNTGHGIDAGYGGTVSDCTVSSNTGDGINATTGSTIRGCTARFNGGDGIEVDEDCLVLNNTCDSNGGTDGAGVHAIGGDNRIDGNNVTDNDRGLDVDVTGNLIIRNSASGNTFNYSQVVSGNTMGEVVDTTGMGGTINETHGPWANFSF